MTSKLDSDDNGENRTLRFGQDDNAVRPILRRCGIGQIGAVGVGTLIFGQGPTHFAEETRGRLRLIGEELQ